MPTTTASKVHVDALWWLLWEAGGSRQFFGPITGDGPKYKLILSNSKTHTTRTVYGYTREELLDGVVALMVEDKLK